MRRGFQSLYGKNWESSRDAFDIVQYASFGGNYGANSYFRRLRNEYISSFGPCLDPRSEVDIRSQHSELIMRMCFNVTDDGITRMDATAQAYLGQLITRMDKEYT